MTAIKKNDDKKLAFAGFVYNITGVKRHPWTKRGPLENIPDETINEADRLGSLRKLSFVRYPIDEAVELGLPEEPHQHFLRELEELHDQLLVDNHRQMEITSETVNETLMVYGDLLSEVIESQTSEEWPFEEVLIIPSIYSGGTVIENIVFLGLSNYHPYNSTVLIHELIHVNTVRANEPLRRELTLPTDAIEVATVITTNNVIDVLNDRIGNSMPYNEYSRYYREFVKDFHEDFMALHTRGLKFSELVIAVEKVMLGHDYKGYFKQHGI